MFECKNIYVLNKKDSDAIVYENADGRIIRLTSEVFDNEEEFRHWKNWSDKNYHDYEKQRHLHSDNTLSLEGLSDKATAVGSVEEQIIDNQQKFEHDKLCCLLMAGFNIHLTATQRRRLRLYYEYGLTTEQIANMENVSHQNISKSIKLAKKKLKEFIKD